MSPLPFSLQHFTDNFVGDAQEYDVGGVGVSSGGKGGGDLNDWGDGAEAAPKAAVIAKR